MERAASELVEAHFRRAITFGRYVLPKDPDVDGIVGEILCWAANHWVERELEGDFWPWAMAYLRYRLIDDWRCRYGRHAGNPKRRQQVEVHYGDEWFYVEERELRVGPSQCHFMAGQPVAEELLRADDLTPEEVVVGELQAVHIAAMMESKLSEVERRVLELRLGGLTLRQTGRVLGFTESRACQLQSKAGAKLRPHV